ncbi:MAG: glucosyltransferase domain-containing protein [Butyrivibrio sp.]|nr:glucosyltransferase domain-containing protein [Butyrivibrio sp.]
MKNKIEKIINYSFTRVKAYAILLFLYILSYYKVLSVDYLYNDDQGRKYMGYHGWLDWSRWTNTILSNFMHTDTFLYDISPLSQIIACAVMALASLLAIQIIFEEKDILLINIFLGLMIGVNPYYIGCMSYKYDSPYMAISVLASILPFYYWFFTSRPEGKQKRIRFVVLSIFCLLVMFTTYQSSAGIYPMLVAVIVLKELFKNDDFKKVAEFIGLSVGCYLASILFFSKVLMMHRGDSGNWAMISSFGELVNNFVSHYRIIYIDYQPIWLALMLLLFISLAVSYIKYYNGKKLRGLLYFVLGILVMSVVTFGANLFIASEEKETIAPRYLYGINIGLAFLLLLLIRIVYENYRTNLSRIKQIYKYAVIFMASFMAYCFVVFSCVYGNALEEQWNYHVFRVHEVINDLTDLDIMRNGQDKKVSFSGTIGLTPIIENYPNRKLIQRILPQTFSGHLWGEFYFRYYFNIPNMLVDDVKPENYDFSDCTLLHESVYHIIYTDDNGDVIISLKAPEQIKWEKGTAN